MPLTSVFAGDGSLIITWSFAVPIQAVWTGLTDLSVLSQWLGRPIECDIRAGGSIVVDHSGDCLSCSVITEIQEPHRLAMTWAFPGEPESRIVIRLRAGEEGTVMEFEHHGLGRLVDSYGPGWITHLTYLEAALNGVALPAPQFWPLYATFETLYAARPAAVTR